MNQWVTVARFDMIPDAYIALGLLRAENIDCHLQDENLVQTDWLCSIAIGGIKLKVKQESAQAAQRILSQDASDLLDSSD